MKSHNVRFWEIRPRKTAKGESWTVRWTVAGREKSVTLVRKAQAERHRARLMQAADRGEAFDLDSGLPDSLAREVSPVTWLELARDFIDARWPKHAGKGRVSLVEGLIAVTPVLVKPMRGEPEPKVLREALRRWAFNPPRRGTAQPADIEAALAWLTKASLPLSALESPAVLAGAVDACGRKLKWVDRFSRVLPSSPSCAQRGAQACRAARRSFGKPARWTVVRGQESP